MNRVPADFSEVSASSDGPQHHQPRPDLLRRRFPSVLRLTPEQFELQCAESRDLVLELTDDGLNIATTSTGGETCARNGEFFSLSCLPTA